MLSFEVGKNSTDNTRYRCSEGALSSTSVLLSVSEALTDCVHVRGVAASLALGNALWRIRTNPDSLIDALRCSRSRDFIWLLILVRPWILDIVAMRTTYSLQLRYGYHVPAVRRRDIFYSKLEEKRSAEANA
jgi:hypothetical protein